MLQAPSQLQDNMPGISHTFAVSFSVKNNFIKVPVIHFKVLKKPIQSKLESDFYSKVYLST